jgi:hypothetical protein
LLGHAKVLAELGHSDNSTQTSRELAAVDNVNICPRTIRRALHREGVVRKRKPHDRQITPKQRRARLKFAHEHLDADLKTSLASTGRRSIGRREAAKRLCLRAPDTRCQHPLTKKICHTKVGKSSISGQRFLG